MESVPEKLEQILQVPAEPELPESNLVENTCEQAAPVEQTEEESDARVKDEEEKPAVEEELPDGEPEPEPSAEPPSEELQQLQIDNDDEKEVDTAEAPEHEEASELPTEENTPATSPAEEEEDKEEEQYKQPKVTLTLPEKDNAEMKAETSKEEKEVQNNDSGGSAADSSSVDLNLSISSFLSKTKEPGSVSVLVSPLSQNWTLSNNVSQNVVVFPGRQEKENPQKDPQVHCGRRGGQRDDVQDHHRQRHQERGDEIPQVPFSFTLQRSRQMGGKSGREDIQCDVCLSPRRQELRELRLLQKEEQRAQQQLSNKLQQQKEQIFRRFEQETTVRPSPS